VDEGFCVDIVFLDLAKAFATPKIVGKVEETWYGR